MKKSYFKFLSVTKFQVRDFILIRFEIKSGQYSCLDSFDLNDCSGSAIKSVIQSPLWALGLNGTSGSLVDLQFVGWKKVWVYCCDLYGLP